MNDSETRVNASNVEVEHDEIRRHRLYSETLDDGVWWVAECLDRDGCRVQVRQREDALIELEVARGEWDCTGENNVY